MRFSYLFLTSIFFLLFACQSEQDSKKQENTDSDSPKGTLIALKGTTNSAQKGLIILKKMQDGQLINIDSAEVNGTSFSLEAYVTEPDFFALNVFGQKDVPLVISPEDKNISIVLDTKKPDFGVEISGSKATDEYYAFEKILQDFTTRFQALEKKYGEQPAELQKSYTALQQESVQRVKVFIDSIGASIVSVRAASVLESDTEFEFLEALHKKMQTVLPDSKYTEQLGLKVKAIAEELEATQHLQVGKPAPEISLATPEGSKLALSSLKGKVVLIDFWASWCGPCRQENPNVLKMYNQHKGKGFEIYGVSLDRKREDWLAAIAQDQLSWKHVSDLQFWQSEAAQTYHVRAIPATYLIGRDGTIIAKNLRGPALEAKLAEVMEKM